MKDIKYVSLGGFSIICAVEHSLYGFLVDCCDWIRYM